MSNRVDHQLGHADRGHVGLKKPQLAAVGQAQQVLLGMHVDAVKGHYRANALANEDSDMHAKQNLLGPTDSRQLRLFEADVTTIRMAELAIDPV